jgi:helix-turn-helix protein
MDKDERRSEFVIDFPGENLIRATTEGGAVTTEVKVEKGNARTTVSSVNLLFSAFAL